MYLVTVCSFHCFWIFRFEKIISSKTQTHISILYTKSIFKNFYNSMTIISHPYFKEGCRRRGGFCLCFLCSWAFNFLLCSFSLSVLSVYSVWNRKLNLHSPFSLSNSSRRARVFHAIALILCVSAIVWHPKPLSWHRNPISWRPNSLACHHKRQSWRTRLTRLAT